MDLKLAFFMMLTFPKFLRPSVGSEDKLPAQFAFMNNCNDCGFSYISGTQEYLPVERCLRLLKSMQSVLRLK